MSVDDHGDMIPETPEAVLLAANTYLQTIQPPDSDPRSRLHKQILEGLNREGFLVSAKISTTEGRRGTGLHPAAKEKSSTTSTCLHEAAGSATRTQGKH